MVFTCLRFCFALWLVAAFGLLNLGACARNDTMHTMSQCTNIAMHKYRNAHNVAMHTMSQCTHWQCTQCRNACNAHIAHSVRNPRRAELWMYSIMHVCLTSSNIKSEKAWQRHRRVCRMDQTRLYHGDVAALYALLLATSSLCI